MPTVRVPAALLLMFGGVTAPGAIAAETPSSPPSTNAIAGALEHSIQQRVREGWAGAIVAGVRGPDGRTRIVTAGRSSAGGRLDGASVFEIGSVTKTFTATLLADAAERGEVTLDEPVAALLPAGTTVPVFAADRAITLADLATQTSGLPRLPDDLLDGADPADPYAHYTRDRLLAGLAKTRLLSAPGSTYLYSNYGFGLLGDALSMHAESPYARLVADRITGPLGLASTSISLGPSQRARFVPGHDGDGTRVPSWRFGALEGAGALRSTTNDLLRYAEANLAAPAGPGVLGRAMASAQAEHWVSGEQHQGLAWVRQPVGGRTLIWHNGGTAGHQSFLGLDPARGTAVVVLSDTEGVSGVTDLGLHAIDRSLSLDELPRFVRLPARALDQLAGTFRVDGDDYEVARKGRTLVVSAGGRRAFVLRPTGRTTFVSKAQDVQVTFVLDRRGRASGFQVTVAGQTTQGTRV